MIGLEFNIDRSINNILKLILENLNTSIYDWYIKENEVINNSELSKKYNACVSGEKLLEIVNTEDFFVYFINLQAFKKNGKYNSINNYEDFLTSECQLIILVSDVYEVEIYFKNIDICEKIYSKIKDNKAINSLHYKKLDTDGRINMHVN